MIDKFDIVAENYVDDYKELAKEIYKAGLKRGYSKAKKTTWIPCSERLPTRDNGEAVLVSTTKAFGALVEVIFVWTSSVELYYRKGWITAWMPLPEPYRGDE